MNTRFAIPDSLISTNTEQRGKVGIEWLAKLPAILAECERRWSLTIGPPFAQLSYNYAAPATRPDGATLVVKIGLPNPDFKAEADALRLYAGVGIVRMLDSDLDMGVILLERLQPGTMLVSVEDDAEATSIAASVMKRLRRPVPPEEASLFPTVADWAAGLGKLRERFDGGTGPFPPKLVDTAERLFSELIGSMGEPVLLHGDLHHFNILAAEREPWLAIDPEGVIGEPEYETGALLRNPKPHIASEPDLPRLLSRRIDQLSEELGFDRERIRGWAVAQAVLSSWWYLEDTDESENHNWRADMVLVEAMAAVS